MCKIINGFDRVKHEPWFKKSSDYAARTTRLMANESNLVKPMAKTEIRINFSVTEVSICGIT